MHTHSGKTSSQEIAEQVRSACIKAAREGFTDASISGLCSEGAMEAAISAMQTLNLDNIVKASSSQE